MRGEKASGSRSSGRGGKRAGRGAGAVVAAGHGDRRDDSSRANHMHAGCGNGEAEPLLISLSAGDAVPVDDCIKRIAAAAGVSRERAEACLRVALEAGDESERWRRWSMVAVAPPLQALLSAGAGAFLGVQCRRRPFYKSTASCSSPFDIAKFKELKDLSHVLAAGIWDVFDTESDSSCEVSAVSSSCSGLAWHRAGRTDVGGTSTQHAQLAIAPATAHLYESREILQVECPGGSFLIVDGLDRDHKPPRASTSTSTPVDREREERLMERDTAGLDGVTCIELALVLVPLPEAERPCGSWLTSAGSSAAGGEAMASWTFSRQELLGLRAISTAQPEGKAGVLVSHRSWRCDGHHLQFDGIRQCKSTGDNASLGAFARIHRVAHKDDDGVLEKVLAMSELRLLIPPAPVFLARFAGSFLLELGAPPHCKKPPASCLLCRMAHACHEAAPASAPDAAAPGAPDLPLELCGGSVALRAAPASAVAAPPRLDAAVAAELQKASDKAFALGHDALLASTLASTTKPVKVARAEVAAHNDLRAAAEAYRSAVLADPAVVGSIRVLATDTTWVDEAPDILFSVMPTAQSMFRGVGTSGGLRRLTIAGLKLELDSAGPSSRSEMRLWPAHVNCLWLVAAKLARHAPDRDSLEAIADSDSAQLQARFQAQVKALAKRVADSWEGMLADPAEELEKPEGDSVLPRHISTVPLDRILCMIVELCASELAADPPKPSTSLYAKELRLFLSERRWLLFRDLAAAAARLLRAQLAFHEAKASAEAARLAAVGAAVAAGERRALEAASRAALSHAWLSLRADDATCERQATDAVAQREEQRRREAAQRELMQEEEAAKAKAAAEAEAKEEAAQQRRRQEQARKAAELEEKRRREEEEAKRKEEAEAAERWEEAERQRLRQEAKERQRVAELESRRQQKKPAAGQQQSAAPQRQRAEEGQATGSRRPAQAQSPMRPVTETRPAQANGTGASAAASPAATQANRGEASDSEELEAAKAELERLQVAILEQRKTTFMIRNEIEKERRRAAERAQAAAPAPRPPGTSVAAKTGGRLCYAFARGQCLNPECPFEHPEGAGGRRQEPSPALAELQRELEAAQAEEAAAGRSLEALSASSQRLRDELGRARAAVGEAESAAAVAERRTAESCAHLSSAAGGAEARRAAAAALEAQAAAAKEAAGAAERECAERGRVVGALECAARLQRQRPAASSDARRSGDAEAVRQLPPEAVARLAARLRAALEVHARGSNPHR